MYTFSINGVEISIESTKSLFSPSDLDRGTRAMLETVSIPDGKILDLGCGCGAVGIYAAKIKGEENVVMCDIDPEAVMMSRKNAAKNGVGGVRVILSDGLREVGESGFSMILSNPPYHTDFSVARRFIEEGYRALAPGGRLVMVVKRREWYENKMRGVFGGAKVTERDGYFVIEAEKRARRGSQKKKPAMSKKLRRKYGITWNKEENYGDT